MQKYMSWRTILLIFALMVVVLPSPGPVIAAEEPPKAPLQISFSPSSKAGGDIVFEFSLPMVESDSLGTAGHPEVIFEPKQEGTFKWRLPTMLVFSPVKGSLSQGQHVTISINAATPLAGKEYALKTPWQAEFTVPGLRIAGKVANWPIIKGQPRFIGFLNWHTEWVGRGPLFLLYDQPVDVDEVRQQLQVTDHHGRRLEMEVYRPKNADLVLEKEIDLEYLVALRILDLPNYERSVTIQLPSWKEYEKPEILQKTLIVNTKFELIESYNTYSRYRPSSRDDGRVPLRTTWVFKFNNRFRVDWFEKALQITPKRMLQDSKPALPGLSSATPN